MRQDREQRRAVSCGLVSLHPSPPERMRDTLPIHPPPPLLSDVPRLHPAERVQGADNLTGQAPVLPDDKGGPPRVHVAEKVPRTKVAIGDPEVTRLHRAQHRGAQRALLGVPIFTRTDITHEARRGLVDHQRLAGQGARRNPAQCVQPRLTRFKRVAIDALHLGARQPGHAFTTHMLDQWRQLAGALAYQCRRSVGLDLLEFVVDGDHRRPDLRFVSPIGRVHGGLEAKDDVTHEVVDRRKQQVACLRLLGRALLPQIEGIGPQDALQCASNHHRDGATIDKALKDGTEHHGLLMGGN
jgi:hypothetical protein